MDADVAIIGGGVAGLWCARSLESNGYGCVVFERGRDVRAQTPAAQGIVHAGVKYRLPGIGDNASRSVSDAACVWDDLLTGKGDPDLSGVKILSEHTYLWSTGGLGSTAAIRGAAAMMRSGVEKLAASERPDWFMDAPKSWDIYRVQERVVSPQSVIETLIDGLRGPLVNAEVRAITREDAGVRVETDDRVFEVGHAIVAAGEGGESIHVSGRPEMQRRPLHMAVATNAPVPIFGHCLGTSNVPRLTLTTAQHENGLTWYIGGGPAERGVGLSEDEQTQRVRDELRACLGWLDLESLDIRCFRIDRAEGLSGGKRPDGPFVSGDAGVTWVWPTKMVLAPEAARKSVEIVQSHSPATHVVPEIQSTPVMPYSHWEESRS